LLFSDAFLKMVLSRVPGYCLHLTFSGMWRCRSLAVACVFAVM